MICISAIAMLHLHNMHAPRMHRFPKTACCLPPAGVERPLSLHSTLDAGHCCVQHLQLAELRFKNADLVSLVTFCILLPPVHTLAPMHVVRPLFWLFHPCFRFPLHVACIAWFSVPAFAFLCMSLRIAWFSSLFCFTAYICIKAVMITVCISYELGFARFRTQAALLSS